MQTRMFPTQRPPTRTEIRQMQRADKALKDEIDKQTDIICSSTAMALWKDFGWRQERISKLLNMMLEAWLECTEDDTASMCSMLEDETGIVMGIPNTDRDYRELLYFKRDKPLDLTAAQRIYMRHRQREWMGAQILASAMLALHRKEGWGYGRLSRFSGSVDAVRAEHGFDRKRLTSACRDLTGIVRNDWQWSCLEEAENG